MNVHDKDTLFKVSELQGGGAASRPEISPYVISQMLVPLEMLLCGMLMGLVALLFEIKRVKHSSKPRLLNTRVNSENAEEVKG